MSQGIIGQNLFGVSILMTVLAALIAPMLLIPLLRMGGAGIRGEDKEAAEATAQSGTRPAANAEDLADHD